MIKNITLEKVKINNRKNYMNYLLMADESEEIINEYINKGDLYTVHYEENLAGVVLFIFHSSSTVELKNIALDSEFRGKGIGKNVIKQSFDLYKRMSYEKMIVGTANSSIDNIAFYQKVGFRLTSIKRDFFKQYPEPIYENGIRAVDMIIFEKIIKD
ncbi:GNAT family N-acetyltransferase [Tenuibacillus multivorans]|uniref:Ribosomal protein S18 acetylase RimI n=1 Tax=Tenuibacillus multivorans TaxID=237069 RepID=A0A1H0ATZ6_9BACI|nr:GNAT family N-acetyltransferase [Tenuibacillus multivorans]GEL77823.1 N-acetyltransferase [Tenuibacillus multivorans]SDN36839.1 Ribosomal protein S18 acetylase RimI [Tenuibacillus multivorans]